MLRVGSAIKYVKNYYAGYDGRVEIVEAGFGCLEVAGDCVEILVKVESNETGTVWGENWTVWEENGRMRGEC